MIERSVRELEIMKKSVISAKRDTGKIIVKTSDGFIIQLKETEKQLHRLAAQSNLPALIISLLPEED